MHRLCPAIQGAISLGFIDEFTQRHAARFILILNSDKLAETQLNSWETLREKVIDQEVKLNTTPREAFDIAHKLVASKYREQVANAVETCGVTNIRVIVKVMRVVEAIMGPYSNLKPAVVNRVIPSIVLLSSVQYRGIEDGPTFDYILNFRASLTKILHPDSSLLDEQEGRWKLLLTQLKIFGVDEFEELVVAFLRSGLFDDSAIKRVMDRYLQEDASSEAREVINSFINDLIWDWRLNDDNLLLRAKQLNGYIRRTDAQTITSLNELMLEVPGLQRLAEEYLEQWLSQFRTIKHENLEMSSWYMSRVHPKIKTELENVKSAQLATTTVLQALRHIVENSGWGDRETFVLRRVTSADMLTLIDEFEIKDFQFFMSKMLDLCQHRATYEQHFGPAISAFISACRSITSKRDSERLAVLIERLFADANQSELLQAEPV